jgi:CubicO group peptidase (beta-lactamase class C family)
MLVTGRSFGLATLILVSAWAHIAHADAPYIDPADDEANFGPPGEDLFWTTAQKVAGFRNLEKLVWTRTIEAGGEVYPLPVIKIDLSHFQFDFEGSVITLEEYIRRQNVAGLLIIKDGNIVYERYELGNTAESRWLSWSVAKSVTSLLVGAAIKDGYIESVDEMVSDYLPRLKNSSYDDVTIRHLMQMASGVEWNEDYADPEADINTLEWDTLSVYEQLKDKPRAAEPGTLFNYNSAEINLVGTLLRSAIGNNLSTYLTEKIWRPFGMESIAFWELSEPGGGEFGGSNISATLRDYGRIGLFAMNNGKLPDGTQVLPNGWIAESTTPSPGYEYYGYLWWLRGEGAFAASGIFGQGIHIDPAHNLVIAQHGALEVASQRSDWAPRLAFFRAIATELDRRTGSD